MLAAWVSLAKPRITVLLVFVALASAVVAGGGRIFPDRVILLVVIGALACAGSALLNNYFDQDIDAVMERTQSRPLPVGKVDAIAVYIVGLALLGLSLAMSLRLSYLVALFVGSGALVYVVVYTLWLKRHSPLNIVIGGAAGSCAALAGWFSVSSQWSLAPLLIALLLFLWTPAHFWSFALVHRESYRKANISMLPVVVGEKETAVYIMVSGGFLMLISLLLYLTGPLKEIYLAGAVSLAGLFLFSSVQLWRQTRRERAWSNYKLSGVYLFGLFMAILLDVLV